MIDVRLTATNPEDSSLVPVPCNVRGELLTVAPVIEVITNDLEIQGDLKVTGSITPSPIELPHDPYEGALLGWQDGQLAWMGESVLLPAGTYGPFKYIEGNEQLDIPQDASGLVNGQQIFMSDSTGLKVSQTYETDTITSVAPAVNQTAIWSDTLTTSSEFGVGIPKTALFDGDFSTGIFIGPESTTGSWDATFATSIPCSALEIYISDAQPNATGTVSVNGGAGVPGLSSAGWMTLDAPSSGTLTSIKMTRTASSGGANGYHYGAVKVNGLLLVNTDITAPSDLDTILTFPTSNNFDKFKVGDLVQEPDSVIRAIDADKKTIDVSGGTWSPAGDGPSNLSTQWSGEGSVFLGLDGSILLRENNKEWVDDYYVSAQAQLIAVRKVGLKSLTKQPIETLPR